MCPAPEVYFNWMDRRGVAREARGRPGHPVPFFFGIFHAAGGNQSDPRQDNQSGGKLTFHR